MPEEDLAVTGDVALRHLPLAVIIVDGTDSLCEYANAQAGSMVGPRFSASAVPLIGQSLSSLFEEVIAPDTLAAMRDAVASGRPAEFKSVAARRGGTDGNHRPRFYDFTCIPLPSDDGSSGERTTKAAVTAYDVTDLAWASRVKNESIGVVAHEFRNFLAPILNAVKLIKARGVADADYELDVIERQGGQLADLVDDLIDEVRLSAGKFTLTRQPVELADVVAQALETAAPLAADHQLTVTVPEQGLVVDVDRGRVAQAIANVIGNAAKFTPAGGKIEVSGTRDEETVVLRVRDQGVGIESAMLPKIFDVFAQGRRRTASHASEGLGFGLAIVGNIIAMHGGQVSANSEGRGRGTEITLSLPAAPEGVRPSPPDAPRHELTAPRTQGLRVLVVDDNLDNATIVASSLETLGYVARHVQNGAAAVDVTRTFQPQVVVLDIGLPGPDGYEVATRLRRASATGDVMFIALTGYSQDADLDRAEAEGFDGYFVKPADVARIDALIQNAHATRASKNQ